MIPRFPLAALCVLGSLTYVAHAGTINGEATYISFSVPGAVGTYPVGINASMTVTGFYGVSGTGARGFLREADGTITTFAVPGALWTQPEGINAAGDVTGSYHEQPGAAVQGFLRYADGRILTFVEDPAAHVGLLPISINDFDTIAGNYVFRTQSAFTRSRDGVFTTIPPPGNETIEVTGINAAGMIAGWYTANYYNSAKCKPVKTGGFVMSPDGEVTRFQPPGTMVEFLEHLPEPGDTPGPHWISIDEAGDITGFSIDADGVAHGFVRNPYGTITAFDPPEGKETYPTSINDGGAIAGYYQYNAGGGPPIGFIRVPY